MFTDLHRVHTYAHAYTHTQIHTYTHGLALYTNQINEHTHTFEVIVVLGALLLNPKP